VHNARDIGIPVCSIDSKRLDKKHIVLARAGSIAASHSNRDPTYWERWITSHGMELSYRIALVRSAYTSRTPVPGFVSAYVTQFGLDQCHVILGFLVLLTLSNLIQKGLGISNRRSTMVEVFIIIEYHISETSTWLIRCFLFLFHAEITEVESSAIVPSVVFLCILAAYCD
jgi:hypothetical protein